MKVSTNWLKEFVTLEPPLERHADRLTKAGLEVKSVEPRPDLKDTVFEVEITTNRPDWLSHVGIAREIHAVENTGFKFPPADNPLPRPMPSGWRIHLKEVEGCPEYTAVLLEGVELGQTPDWMRDRLLACGLRPINLIVDITNYALLEVGQPLHAFDADLLLGKVIEVRRARQGETLTAINGTSYPLTPEDLVIADRDRAVAIAGVMGGRETEVNERTRNILLESAFFDPRWVRRTSRRLACPSESSYRFERRVDPEGVDFGRERAVYLVRKLAGARSVSAVLRAGGKPEAKKTRILLTRPQVEKLLGMETKAHEIQSVLTRLGLEPKSENPETWSVRVPSHRADLERPVDLVEEIARIGGYEKIPETLPERAPLEIRPDPLRELEEKTRDFFVGLGFFEMVTFSLVNPRLFQEEKWNEKEWVAIHNPIHQELTLLRPSFLPSLLEVLSRNERVGERSLLAFEVANRYFRKSSGGLPQEEKTLALLLAGERPAGWSDPKRPLHFFDLKGFVESYLGFLGIGEVSFLPVDFPFLNPASEIRVSKETVGKIGAVKASLKKAFDLQAEAFYAEISLEALLRHVSSRKKFMGIPRYPAIERDLSVVVEESVPTSEIVEGIKGLGQGLIRSVELFDLYRGPRIPAGKKNLAFRVVYQSLERTLLSTEVGQLHERVSLEIAKKFGAAFQQN